MGCTRLTTFLTCMLALTATCTPVRAHPHVWITYETTLVYETGSLIGFDHVWTFDDMYTAMAIQGLDKDGDGTYTREELAELAEINMQGLKDFDYFTYAKLGNGELKMAGPKDAWLEHTNGILKLHFRLNLEQPVLAEAENFTASVYDPSFFISFEPAKTDAVKMAAGAPQGCKAGFIKPRADADNEELKAKLLDDAFAQELGKSTDIGAGFTKTITVSCAKS